MGKKASVSYFDETHSHCFTQDVGIRIAGNSTRGFPQKSFNLFVRDIYGGDEKLPEDFFDDGVLYSSIKMMKIHMPLQKGWWISRV